MDFDIHFELAPDVARAAGGNFRLSASKTALLQVGDELAVNTPNGDLILVVKKRRMDATSARPRLLFVMDLP